ncbi:hypothetical protein V2177_03915 [Bacillus licheniformis]|uniref:hypothetical protein n=1 Tax=Bacillus licheniformis TaxID=1402 RepID=UPI00223C47C8|nr:hypothetical protein [Bacillus licheniformis]
MDNELEYLLDSVGLSWRETEISQLIFHHKWHDAAQKLEEKLKAAPFDPGLLISAAFVCEKSSRLRERLNYMMMPSYLSGANIDLAS